MIFIVKFRQDHMIPKSEKDRNHIFSMFEQVNIDQPQNDFELSFTFSKFLSSHNLIAVGIPSFSLGKNSKTTNRYRS